jgi:hypothetical protein
MGVSLGRPMAGNQWLFGEKKFPGTTIDFERWHHTLYHRFIFYINIWLSLGENNHRHLH